MSIQNHYSIRTRMDQIKWESFLLIAQVLVSISGTGLYRRVVMKYRLAMKKQLFITRLLQTPIPSTEILLGLLQPAGPALLLHFLLDEFQYQKNETLPGTETALGQHCPLTGCWPAWTQDTVLTLLADKNRQQASAAWLYFSTFHSATEHFWELLRNGCLSKPHCFAMFLPLFENHTNTVWHLDCSALSRLLLQLHSMLFAGRLKAPAAESLHRPAACQQQKPWKIK